MVLGISYGNKTHSFCLKLVVSILTLVKKKTYENSFGPLKPQTPKAGVFTVKARNVLPGHEVI